MTTERLRATTGTWWLIGWARSSQPLWEPEWRASPWRTAESQFVRRSRTRDQELPARSRSGRVCRIAIEHIERRPAHGGRQARRCLHRACLDHSAVCPAGARRRRGKVRQFRLSECQPTSCRNTAAAIRRYNAKLTAVAATELPDDNTRARSQGVNRVGVGAHDQSWSNTCCCWPGSTEGSGLRVGPRSDLSCWSRNRPGRCNAATSPRIKCVSVEVPRQRPVRGARTTKGRPAPVVANLPVTLRRAPPSPPRAAIEG